jgi:hypothetical protein
MTAWKEYSIGTLYCLLTNKDLIRGKYMRVVNEMGVKPVP